MKRIGQCLGERNHFRPALFDLLGAHRDALYPETVNIDLESAKRVEQSLIAAGLIKSGASVSGLHDTTIVGG